ncbi:DUF6283 family protein [Streptomyces syringium]|uniref:DUF6283 family protein n=1 Tax=Streptomyces syringium TaxID=76729 RepID=UPI0037D1784E
MSTPPSPFSAGSERAQQARARLAELGAAAGIPLEEILQQLAKASAFSVDLPTDLAALVPEAPGRVVRQRPGDEEWGVETRLHGMAAAQPRPCSGEKVCPWRRDAPVGQFPPEVYVHSAPGNRTSGPG